MEISNIVATKTDVSILHPATDEQTGLVFSVLPLSDPKVKAVIRQIRTKLLGKRKQRFSPTEEEQNSVDILVASVCGIKWENDAEWNGKKPKYSEEIAREILETESCSWIRDQLQEELGETPNFFTK